MKLILGMAVVIAAVFSGSDDGARQSVLEPSSQPVLVDNGPVVTRSYQDSALTPAVVEDAISAPQLQEALPVEVGVPLVVGRPAFHLQPAQFSNCECVVCCKPPKHQEMEFELVDPNGCAHIACVKVPFCCVNELPVVSWKCRPLGRQIATLFWECCDHEVKVVVTRRGKVRVRD